MAKKSLKKDELLKSNNSIIAELRNDRWIYNPVVYSQISGDFTLLQQRILVGIVERLQQRIVNSIDERKRTNTFADIFNDEELDGGKDTIEINIPTEDLGILPSHYAQLQQAASSLGNIRMKYPLFDIKGRVKSLKDVALFPLIEMPVHQRQVDGEDVAGKRKGVLRIVMLKENIRDVFTMQHGYIRHISQIVTLAQKKRTPRLYIYLSRYKDIGHKQVPYTDLLEYLGLTDEYYFHNNDGAVVNPFAEWNRVKSQVIVPVQKEMKELANKGDIDICFDFSPVYPHGKKRGAPAFILFTIHKSVLGEQRHEYDKRKNAIYKWVDTFVSWCPDLSQFDLLKIVDDMPDGQLQQFIDYAYKDVRKLVEKVQPDSVAPYVVSCFRNWKKQYHQQDLFSQSYMEIEQQRKAHEAAERKANELHPGEHADEWQQVMEHCPTEYKEYLQHATYEGTIQGFPFVSFPSKQLLDAFNAFEGDDRNKPVVRQFEVVRKKFLSGTMAWRILKRGLKP